MAAKTLFAAMVQYQSVLLAKYVSAPSIQGHTTPLSKTQITGAASVAPASPMVILAPKVTVMSAPAAVFDRM